MDMKRGHGHAPWTWRWTSTMDAGMPIKSLVRHRQSSVSLQPLVRHQHSGIVVSPVPLVKDQSVSAQLWISRSCIYSIYNIQQLLKIYIFFILPCNIFFRKISVKNDENTFVVTVEKLSIQKFLHTVYLRYQVQYTYMYTHQSIAQVPSHGLGSYSCFLFIYPVRKRHGLLIFRGKKPVGTY